MPISVQCPACGKEMSVRDELAGRLGKCPDCGQPVRIPVPGAAPPPVAAAAPPAGDVSDKSQGVAFLLSFFLGMLGADRFYLGYTGLGILKLCTAGGCGIWALIDTLMTGMGSQKDAQGNSLLKT